MSRIDLSPFREFTITALDDHVIHDARLTVAARFSGDELTEMLDMLGIGGDAA